MSRRLCLLLLTPLVLLSLWASCKSVPFTAPAGCTMTLSANPGQIALDGGTSTITIHITEASGSPVPNDTVVTLTTTLGSVTPEVKTRDGIAQAFLQSSGQSGEATVTALSGACGSQTTKVTVGIAGASLSLSANPASLPVGGGTTTISATVFGASGVVVPGASVVFNSTHGRLASGNRPVLTDSTGRATDTLTTTETTEVTAVAGSQSKTITVPVGSADVASIVLAASQVNLPATGGSTDLTAVVLGSRGPVAGVAVAWSNTSGALTTAITVTDADGVATNRLSTSLNSTVTAAAGSKTASLNITVGASIAANVAVSASRSSIPGAPSPDGDCSAPGNTVPVTVYAQVTDSNGAPLPGREVIFYIDFSALSDCGRAFGQFCSGSASSVTATTNANGVATVQWTTTQADLDFCNCLPSGCNCFPSTVTCVEATPTPTTPTPTPPTPTPPRGRGYCPNSGATCSVLPTCRVTASTSEDLFCQAPVRAVSGGVTSINIQYIEYGK